MELIKIQEIANQLLSLLTPFIKQGMICGSIRRKKADCRDIDIVLIPKNDFMSLVIIKQILIKQSKKLLLDGLKIFRFIRKEDGLQIDIYLANEKDYGVLCLLKTGSKEHNIKLCSLAKRKNWKVTAEGLVIGNEIIRGEKEILEKVFGKCIEPEEREINSNSKRRECKEEN